MKNAAQAILPRHRNPAKWRLPRNCETVRNGDENGMAGKSDGPTGAEKRRVYLTFFLIALAVEVLLALTRDGPFRLTLIGTAVMITAVLFYIYSLIRER